MHISISRLPGGTAFLASPFWRRVAGGAALLFLGTMAGRVVGFVRESLLAYRLGVSEAADVAIVSFTFADLLTNLLIAGSMSGVLIPEFARLFSAPGDRRRGVERDAGLYWLVLGWMLPGAAAIALLAALASPFLVRLLAPGLQPADAQHAQALMRVSAWAFPSWAVVGVSTAFLHHRGRFGVPALQNVLFNTVAIAALIFLVSASSLRPLAAAAVVGAAVVALSQVARVIALVGPPRIGDFALPPAIWRRYMQALMTGVGIFALPFLVRAIGSNTGPGAIAIVNFATKMAELPNGTVIAALSVALFPNLSAMFEGEYRSHAIAQARRGALALFAAGAVASLVLAIPADFWARLLFGRGQITAEDVHAVGSYARLLALGLPAQGLVPYAISLFATQRDYVRPFALVVALMALFAVLANFLVSAMGLSGLAVAQSVFYWVLAAALFAVLAARHGIAVVSLRRPVRGAS